MEVLSIVGFHLHNDYLNGGDETLIPLYHLEHDYLWMEMEDGGGGGGGGEEEEEEERRKRRRMNQKPRLAFAKTKQHDVTREDKQRTTRLTFLLFSSRR